MKQFLLLLIFVSLISQTIHNQNDPARDTRMKGWREARLGMITH